MKITGKYHLFILFLVLSCAGPAFAGTDWRVELLVRGSGTSGSCALGVRDDATDVHDYAYDVRAMLDSLNDSASYCYFPHPEWEDIATAHFREDIKADGVEKQWTLEILSTVSGELILEWPEVAQKIPGHRVYLTDLGGTGQVVDMQAVSSVAFDTIVNTPRRFTITVVSPAVPPVDTLWADERDLRVRLGWERTVNPDAAGYDLYRKLPDRPFEKINSNPIDPLREFYLDNLTQIVLDSRRSVTVVYILKTISAGPLETVIQESNEVAVTIDPKPRGSRRDR